MRFRTRNQRNNVVAESAIREWLPGPEDTSGIRFEWTPIHGRFEKHEIIKAFFFTNREQHDDSYRLY